MPCPDGKGVFDVFASLTATNTIAQAASVVSNIGPVYMVPIGISIALLLVGFAVRLAKRA